MSNAADEVAFAQYSCEVLSEFLNFSF